MKSLVGSKEYKQWLTELKGKIQKAQIKAAVKVNTELLLLYWEMGADIVKKQKNAKWGEGFVEQLSSDLMREFPDMKGFSRSNLMYIRQWYLFYSSDKAIVQQLVGQLVEIPWGHNITIITKCENVKEALYYVQNTIKHNWSRSVLVHQIESGLVERDGRAVNNFVLTLPKAQSDLALQTLKDPYIFDFLSMTENYHEKELEDSLVEHITKFLLELGAGFAYVGQQIRLEIGEGEFFIDLLFYHIRLHCYVVVELKTGKFEPEHAGKLNFYVTAVDRQLKSELDQPTIGILICKTKDKVIAEYALNDIKKPIGVSEYQLTRSLPKQFKSNLPTIKEIEAELSQCRIKKRKTKRND